MHDVFRELKTIKTLDELTAEVIAEKSARAEWIYIRDYGPGRITDLEINQERIYNV